MSRTPTHGSPNVWLAVGGVTLTGKPVDRYMFRTSPLRNVALQPAFLRPA